MKGLAGVFQAAGEKILVEEVDVPELEEGSILLRNTGGAVCGSDLHGWRGDGDKPMRKNRYVGGHECTGVVDTLTGGITTDSLRRPLKEGDRVVFPFFFPCQRCYQCAQGEMHALHLPQPPEDVGRFLGRLPVLRRRIRPVLQAPAQPLDLQGPGRNTGRLPRHGKLLPDAGHVGPAPGKSAVRRHGRCAGRRRDWGYTHAPSPQTQERPRSSPSTDRRRGWTSRPAAARPRQST